MLKAFYSLDKFNKKIFESFFYSKFAGCFSKAAYYSLMKINKDIAGCYQNRNPSQTFCGNNVIPKTFKKLSLVESLFSIRQDYSLQPRTLLNSITGDFMRVFSALCVFKTPEKAFTVELTLEEGTNGFLQNNSKQQLTPSRKDVSVLEKDFYMDILLHKKLGKVKIKTSKGKIKFLQCQC